MSIPLPNAVAIATLLTDLVGRNVTAKTATASPLTPKTSSIAEYRSEDGAIQAVVLCDLPLGASFGAALTMIPPATVDDCIKEKKLEATLAENLYEIYNVLAAVFPKSGGPRLILRGVHHGTDLAADMAAVVAKPSKRVDLDVSVASYKTGRMTILAA